MKQRSLVRRGRRSIAASVVTALIAGFLGIAGFGSAQPARAAISDRPAITWNMQGGGNTWGTDLASMANPPGSAPPVLTLQEAGQPPARAHGTAEETFSANQPGQLAPLPPGMFFDVPVNPGARTVVHTQWQLGTSTRGVIRHVYFLQTDRNSVPDPNGDGGTMATFQGGRVNLAIVTPQAADQVVIIPTPGGQASDGAVRAALGVRIGTTWYFTVHASANGGTTAPGTLQAIAQFMDFRQQQPPFFGGEDAFIGGDFNRAPGNYAAGQIPNHMQIVNSGQTTHNQGGTPRELDYGFEYRADNQFPGMHATVLPTRNSDHNPVLFANAPLAPTPTAFPVMSSVAVENMQSGGVLDVAGNRPDDFTPIDSFVRNSQQNQSWEVDAYPDGSVQFRGRASGRCIDITNSNQNPGAGTGLSLFDCGTGNASQRWFPVQLGNNEFNLESALLPGLCMNLTGGQTNPSTAVKDVLWSCGNGANERFTFTAAVPVSTDTDTTPVELSHTTPSPTSLENLAFGGIMDVAGAKTANGSIIDAFPRNGQPNQGWKLKWNGNGWATFVDSNSNRCLDINNSNTATAGRNTVIWDCTGQASQTWIPIPEADGVVNFASQLNPNLCLEVNQNPLGTPTQGNVVVDTCNPTTTTQGWMFTPFSPAAPTPFPDPDDHPGDELTAVPSAPTAAVPAQRIGYYTSWSTYANAFYPKNLDTEGIAGKLTTLNYAFENIDPVNLTCMEANKASSADESNPTGNDGSSDAFADYQKEYTAANSVNGTADVWNQPLRGNFNQLKELKAKYPNLKILLTIGGWTYSKYFSDVAATDASRKKFVSSCIDMFIKGNLPTGISGDPAGGTGAAAGIFDGFDIDWEFPGSNNGHLGNHVSAQDGANFTLLLNEFRTELNALSTTKHYSLTAALPAGPNEIKNLNLPDLAKVLDMANVMTYDFHGAFEPTGPANSQAPLYDSPNSPASGTGFNVASAIASYTSGGFPASQLSLGEPFYGRGWTNVPDGGTHGLYQTANGPSGAFPLSVTPGVADYKELESAGLLTPGNLFFDNDTDSSWFYDGKNFISIETPTSLAYKRLFIQTQGLGGVMMYSLEADDPSTTLLNAATGLK